LRFFLSGRCVNAEAAVLLAFFDVLLLRNCWEAILPTRFEVFSFLAILFPFKSFFYKTTITVLLGCPSPALFIATTRYSSSIPFGWSTKVDSVSIAVAILLYDFYRPVQSEV
jgi:hypothetical protein